MLEQEGLSRAFNSRDEMLHELCTSEKLSEFMYKEGRCLCTHGGNRRGLSSDFLILTMRIPELIVGLSERRVGVLLWKLAPILLQYN